jgi:hypothetical protein
MMSNRISSRSRTTKAAPHSTSQSQRMTLSSWVHPMGKFTTYLKNIWTMNAANITPSIAAATFSARRASQDASELRGAGINGAPKRDRLFQISAVMPAKAGIQYSAALAVKTLAPWNTGSPRARGRR